jgi:glycosyltransferase involved in cell wall biosynthesis
MQSTSSPKVSIFTTVKNGECYLIDTIESIVSQTFTDYEHVVADGASTDNTVEILEKYPKIRWVSEPDSSAAEGFHKALQMCRGDYIFQCCISDGFLDKQWFETCVNILDSNQDISMVYGLPQYMSEDGHLGKVAYSEFFDQPPPQKEDFLPFWLATRFVFPEGNYCVRRNVYIECFPSSDSTDFYDIINPFMRFNFNFNTRGYLPFFVPYIANFGRVHNNQITERLKNDVEQTFVMYVHDIDNYKCDLVAGQIQHLFRDGNGNVIGNLQTPNSNAFKDLLSRYIQTYRIYFDIPTSLITKKENWIKSRSISCLRRLVNHASKRLAS